jgi:beta-lactamase superfamily II metal-dependent hydrolase
MHNQPTLTIGQPFPPWSPGLLDIHHINTGKGNATLLILPDGTTMLMDAGELDPTNPRHSLPWATPPRPNGDRTPGQWIVRYIRQMLAHQAEPTLDYALITHFHDDHTGGPSALAPLSPSGRYKLSGITEVGEYIPIRKLLDRGWPDYNYPAPLEDKLVKNYRAFLAHQIEQRGLVVERFEAGRNDQLVLVNEPARYDNFEIRNLAVNGEVWTGVGRNTRCHFPPIEHLQPAEYPDENMCSMAIRLSYGKFDYFTGADLPGMLELGAPLWHDLETPVAQVVGPVEVNVVNHHGNRSSANDYLLRALRPRVHILQTWCSDHPGYGVLMRLLSTWLYPGPRDIFATDILEANRLVIGDLVDRLAGDRGHIVVRVVPGGDTYQVILLDDTAESYRVAAIHGPYTSR